jgi:hypothetical protein
MDYCGYITVNTPHKGANTIIITLTTNLCNYNVKALRNGQ